MVTSSSCGEDETTTVRLLTGYSMPRVGMGTTRLVEAEIRANIEAGARHLDCARVYGNEAAVGRAIAASGVPRSEFFLTSKVFCTDMRRDRLAASVAATLADLQTEYLDLLLIHWPMKWAPGTILQRDGAVGDFAEAWGAMEALAAAGAVRSLGVSNFSAAQLDALPSGERRPCVNQIEAHPLFPNSALVRACAERGVVCVAWGPLSGNATTLGERDPILWTTAKMLGLSVARVALRWNLERGVCVIPKTTNPAHVKDALAACRAPRLAPADARLLADTRRPGRRRFPDLIGVWSESFVAFRALGTLLSAAAFLVFLLPVSVDPPALARSAHERREARHAATIAARAAAAAAGAERRRAAEEERLAPPRVGRSYT